jgi:glycosyltransferase involved in cell wall biosynthesis
MSDEPEITVVIPTRNRWRLLSTHALPSALAQEDVDLEIVVVDDASEDETPACLADIDDPRLRTVRHEVRQGLPAARNSGAAAARGAWLAFLDDDDLWAPRKLRAQLDAAATVGAEWAYGKGIVVDAEKHVIDLHPFPEPEQLATLLLGGNHVPGGGSNVIVRADMLRRLGGFDEELRYFEDWDLWLRLAQCALPAACPEVVVARVEHGQNMLFRDRANVVADFEQLLAKHRAVTRRDRLSVAEWLAHEHVRAGLHARASMLYLRAALTYRSPGNLVPALGALFGKRGIVGASRLLLALRGRSHLDEALKTSPPPEPPWLERYRSPLPSTSGTRSQTARKL